MESKTIAFTGAGAQQSAGSVFLVHESTGAGGVDLLADRLRGRVRHAARRGQILAVRMGRPEPRDIVEQARPANESGEPQQVHAVQQLLVHHRIADATRLGHRT